MSFPGETKNRGIICSYLWDKPNCGTVALHERLAHAKHHMLAQCVAFWAFWLTNHRCNMSAVYVTRLLRAWHHKSHPVGQFGLLV